MQVLRDTSNDETSVWHTTRIVPDLSASIEKLLQIRIYATASFLIGMKRVGQSCHVTIS